MSKDTFNECSGVDTLFAECFADIPAEVHQVDTFECRINLYGRYLAWGVAQTIFCDVAAQAVKFRLTHIDNHSLHCIVENAS